MDYSTLSLFAGAGGMDQGFINAGFNIAGANEIDHYACATYRTNHPACRLIQGSIDECLPALESFRGVDVIVGGPPCQGFSVAGRMDPNDPRNKLVFSFADAVKRLRPAAFVMENVRALGELSKFADLRKELVSQFEAFGYNVSMHVLSAQDFGVPQKRDRVFFVGVKRPLRPVEITDFRPFRKPAVTLREAIEHLGPEGSSRNPKTCNAKITLAKKSVLRKSPYAGMIFNGQGRPLNPEVQACTLPATMGGNRTPIIDEDHLYNGGESWVEWYHAHLMCGGKPSDILKVPDQLRRLTIKEAAILQSFPPQYVFVGPHSQIYRQIGNAVPVELARAVAGALLNKFKEAS